ncbi:MAG: hypothetical protein WD906_05885 [Anaerolineales bacterium]
MGLTHVRRLISQISQAVVVLALLAAPVRAWAQGNSGVILSLTGTSGDPITISATMRADTSIQTSNLLYKLYSPSGALLSTRKVDAPRGLNAGDTFGDSWDYSNPPETGNYRVTLCWSTGNAENCDIAGAETGFYSVPTMGWIFGLASMGLLGVFLHRRRAAFIQVAR